MGYSLKKHIANITKYLYYSDIQPLVIYFVFHVTNFPLIISQSI